MATVIRTGPQTYGTQADGSLVPFAETGYCDQPGLLISVYEDTSNALLGTGTASMTPEPSGPYAGYYPYSITISDWSVTAGMIASGATAVASTGSVSLSASVPVTGSQATGSTGSVELVIESEILNVSGATALASTGSVSRSANVPVSGATSTGSTGSVTIEEQTEGGIARDSGASTFPVTASSANDVQVVAGPLSTSATAGMIVVTVSRASSDAITFAGSSVGWTDESGTPASAPSGATTFTKRKDIQSSYGNHQTEIWTATFTGPAISSAYIAAQVSSSTSHMVSAISVDVITGASSIMGVSTTAYHGEPGDTGNADESFALSSVTSGSWVYVAVAGELSDNGSTPTPVTGTDTALAASGAGGEFAVVGSDDSGSSHSTFGWSTEATYWWGCALEIDVQPEATAVSDDFNRANSLPVWSYNGSYVIGDSVIYQEIKYTSLQSANNHNTPSSSPTWWQNNGTPSASENGLGSNWATLAGTDGMPNISGNLLYGPAVAVLGARWAADSFAADHYSELATVSGAGCAPAVRMQSGAHSCYYARWEARDDGEGGTYYAIVLGKVSAGSVSTIAEWEDWSYASPSGVLRVEASGTTIRALTAASHGGTYAQRCSVTDSALSGGSAGVYKPQALQVAGDNWYGGDL